MKKLFVSAALLCLSLSSSAYTLEDLEGTYMVSIPSIDLSYDVEFEADGYAHIAGPGLWCSGFTTIEDNIVSTEYECDAGPYFIQSFDISKVTGLEEFNAPITSELQEQVEVGHFTKIE